MVFKKKDEPKAEEKKESTFTLEDLVGDIQPDFQEEELISYALRILRRAIRAGQIRCKRHLINDVVFGITMTKEEAIAQQLRYEGNRITYPNRVTYASPLDELTFVSAATLREEKIQSLKAKLAHAQASQKQKVEEIEALSKQLGELE